MWKFWLLKLAGNKQYNNNSNNTHNVSYNRNDFLIKFSLFCRTIPLNQPDQIYWKICVVAKQGNQFILRTPPTPDPSFFGVFLSKNILALSLSFSRSHDEGLTKASGRFLDVAVVVVCYHCAIYRQVVCLLTIHSIYHFTYVQIMPAGSFRWFWKCWLKHFKCIISQCV